MSTRFGGWSRWLSVVAVVVFAFAGVHSVLILLRLQANFVRVEVDYFVGAWTKTWHRNEEPK